MTFQLNVQDNFRFGTFDILGKTVTVPSQIITTLNLDHANAANCLNLDFGSTILEITELCPSKLVNDKSYQKIRIDEIKQIIKSHPDKLCIFGIKGIKNAFRVTKKANEFLIDFQIVCGFTHIHAYFTYNKNAKDDLIYFRNLVKSKKKFFVACVDEKLSPIIFESLYMDCLGNKDEIISFFGRRLTSNNIDNFNLISARLDDNILRLSLSISKSNYGMANSIIYNILGFDCFSFSRKVTTNQIFGRLVALDGLYFDTLSKNTKLICVLSGENLYDSSQNFKKSQNFEYLPIHIHDMIKLNQLLKKLHQTYTNKELTILYENRLL